MNKEISFWIFIISYFSIFFGSVLGQCRDDQKSLLLDLKNSLKFDSSHSVKLVAWNRTIDCCRWPGIKCDRADHVTGLDLNNESIDGSIDDSSSLFGLRFLETLNLAYNNFNSSPLPSAFEKLTQVSYLNLSNANFEGQIPIVFTQMTNLITLDLSSSDHYTLKLENPNLKTLIRNLTNLQKLHLDNINISTNGYNWCNVISSYLRNLRVLSLRGCSLSGPIDSSLSNLEYLSVILLDSNPFLTTVPESIARLKTLTVLSLRSCNLNGTIPMKIFQVPTLKTLDLASNSLLAGRLPEFPINSALEILDLSYTTVGGKLPDSIGNLRMLSRIELNNCKFIGSLPDSMQNLTKLVYVNLSGNKFIGSIPSFRKSKGLTWLNLYSNNLTGEIPTSNWEGLDNLEFLDLGSNFLVGKFPEFLLTLPLLEDLDFSNNRLSGQISKIVNVSCYKLRNLDLSNNRFEGLIPGFIFELPSLSTLSLSSNNFNGNVDLDMFGKFKDLYALDLSNNEFSVTTNSNRSAFSSLSRLNTLQLASCKMQKLPDLKNQTRLMQLDLSNNDLEGEIPNWIWEIGNGYLRFLNLSSNRFSSLQKPYTFPFLLDVLDLHSNNLKGNIPIPPRRVYHLDYSNNNFESSIPIDFGNVLTSTLFFSIANNKFSGVIPESLCNASNLRVLDLSNNSFNGSIPSCLSQTNKNLQESCDLNVNNLKNPISESWKNCRKNKILDLDDEVIDGFSRNRFQMLKVVNFSHNLLTGRIPFSIGSLKSLESLDLSSNMLDGSIPEELTSLGLLSFLNLSYNRLTGRIPQFRIRFTELSFEGNEGLCGAPLKKSCDHNNGRS